MLDKDILKKINKIADPKIRKNWKLNYLTKIHKVKNREIRSDFLTFVKYIWPDFIEGNHHQTISDKFNRLQSGDLKRLIINMPPRHTKSEFASYFLPDGRIAGNSTTSHLSALSSAPWALINCAVKSFVDHLVMTRTIRPPGCKR